MYKVASTIFSSIEAHDFEQRVYTKLGYSKMYSPQFAKFITALMWCCNEKQLNFYLKQLNDSLVYFFLLFQIHLTLHYLEEKVSMIFRVSIILDKNDNNNNIYNYKYNEEEGKIQPCICALSRQDCVFWNVSKKLST